MRKEIPVAIDKYPDQKVEISYAETPGYVFFTRRSRPADYIDLCKVDIHTGEVKEVISEHLRRT